jgi:DNA-binding protein HU-beta
MVTVGKDAIARDIAAKNNITVAAANLAIDAVTAAIRDHAQAGNNVRLIGFGSFSVRARPARTGRNPRTGEAVAIPETRRLVFKASKTS